MGVVTVEATAEVAEATERRVASADFRTVTRIFIWRRFPQQIGGVDLIAQRNLRIFTP